MMNADTKNEIAFNAMLTAAQTGDALAQFKLSLIYEDGKGVLKDYVEAMKWLRLSAKQGHASAQYTLGMMYYKGKDVSQNCAKAAKWFRRAAKQGLTEAQYKFGVIYANGLGMPINEPKAMKWYRRAAKQGHASAQHNLAFMYEESNKEFQDDENGNEIIQSGRELQKNRNNAMKWYLRAAKQGDASAQNNLMMKYYFGEGARRDYLKAYKWSNLSAAQGCQNAKNIKELLEKEMTREQIAEGQKLASEFVAVKE